MKKIPTLFVRDPDDRRFVTRDVTPGCEVVARGECIATFKWDGTACLIDASGYYKRFTLRKGKSAPPGFMPATEVDLVTGKQEGWVLVGDDAEDRWHRKAFDPALPFGTYELIGPKVQGNPHRRDEHVLIPHGSIECAAPTDYDGLRGWMLEQQETGFEGLVWWKDGAPVAKLKRRDFLHRDARGVLPRTDRTPAEQIRALRDGVDPLPKESDDRP